MEKRTMRPHVVFGMVLVILGVMMLLERLLPWAGNLAWAAIFAVTGFLLLGVYSRSKPRRWPLIPAYVAFALAGLMLVELVRLPGDLTGAYVMYAVAIPFIYVYLRDRKVWALIPGGVMAVIGTGLLLESMVWLFPVALIVGGLLIIIRQFGKSREKSEPMPTSGPSADRARE
jgi:hypothetical protein